MENSHAAPDLSLVIPVYNERDSLIELQGKILDVVNELGIDWEIIYIDDGSTDGSTEMLRQLHEQDERVIVAVQRRNNGKSIALAVGFALARGRTVITMDADLQDDPSEIPRLMAKLDEGFDVVTGWKQNRQDPLSKRIPSFFANKATQIMTGVRLKDMNSGLKAYRGEVVKNIQVYGSLHRYIPVLAHYAGFRVTEIPVTHHKRKFGVSKYGLERLLEGAFDLLTILFLHRYGRRPLHFLGGVGGLLLFVGFIINFALTIEWFRGVRPIGDRPALTLGVLLMLMGLQLLIFGLVAELLVAYINRTENPLVSLLTVYRSGQRNGAQPDHAGELANAQSSQLSQQ